MTTDVFRNARILAGPTGSGKTELGLELAERLDAEIISMDSMALYRGMDVGTAKPSRAERARVPHHLVDVLDPWESASVAWWLEQAAECRREIERRGKCVLFVGGTPLYLKALLCGLFEGPPADAEIRQRLLREADSEGPERLFSRLQAIDQATAERLHPNDLRRVIRALEVWELTGRPISAWQTQWLKVETREVEPRCCLWLDLPREVLYARINARVERMMAAGLLEEVRQLRALPRPLSQEASQALGYKDLLEHLDGKTGLDDAVERIQTRTRQFAKRQLTWFRNLPGCRPASRELTFSLWGLTIVD